MDMIKPDKEELRQLLQSRLLTPCPKDSRLIEEATIRAPFGAGSCSITPGPFSDVPGKGGPIRWLASFPLFKTVATLLYTCLTSHMLPNPPPFLVVFSTSQSNQEVLLEHNACRTNFVPEVHNTPQP